MLTIDRSASVSVPAPAERCLELLADVEAYPTWASLIRQAELVDDRLRLRAELLRVPFVMDCAFELGSGQAVLRRLPHGPEDEERYEATWTVTPDPSGSRVDLRVVAALDAPGPARFARGRIERKLVDELLQDFARSL
jgi:ribosome-associated toxin RatA of RatAB toxin-antitoxin module